MPTIHEDIENLDRLVDGGAAKDEIRSQIRLIDREVAALEAENAGLIEAKTQSDQIAAAAVKAYNELKAQKAAVVLDVCDYCGQKTGKLLRIEPDKKFGEFGAKVRFYKCTNPDCGKEYERPEDLQHPGFVGGDPLIEP